jgi:5-aminopentanamidase
MRIALLQMTAIAGDVPANLARIAEAATSAEQQSADLLITPELATVGYGAGDDIHHLAELRDGAQIASLAAIAADAGLAIIAGFAERDRAFIYNSAVFTDGRSEPVIYRKSHLYGDYEQAIFAAGDPTATIVAWRGLKLGLLICYDVEFPENVRRLALAGADLVAVPTALPVSPEAEMIAERVIAVRAFENQIFVAYANHTGRDDHFAYAGLSHVAAPDGSTLAKASATEAGLIIAELRPGEYGASRAANTYLRDLRR